MWDFFSIPVLCTQLYEEEPPPVINFLLFSLLTSLGKLPVVLWTQYFPLAHFSSPHQHLCQPPYLHPDQSQFWHQLSSSG